jgi:hypothetical protein
MTIVLKNGAMKDRKYIEDVISVTFGYHDDHYVVVHVNSASDTRDDIDIPLSWIEKIM